VFLSAFVHAGIVLFWLCSLKHPTTPGLRGQDTAFAIAIASGKWLFWHITKDCEDKDSGGGTGQFGSA